MGVKKDLNSHIKLEIFLVKNVCKPKKNSTFASSGEMAEWSIAAVLKTVVPRGTWGSNPYFSADRTKPNKKLFVGFFILPDITGI